MTKVEVEASTWRPDAHPSAEVLDEAFLLALQGVEDIPQVEHWIVGSRDNRSATHVLLPRITSFEYHRQGVSMGRGLLSFAAWLTTWIGGGFVPDTVYDVDLEAEIDCLDLRNGVLAGTWSIEFEDRIVLDFFDRNPVISLGVLESLVWPMPWTHDDPRKVERALLRKALRRGAHGTDLRVETLPGVEF